MRVEVAGPRLLELADLRPQPPDGELGEHVRVGLAGDQRVKHRAPRLAHDVRRDRVQLDPGVL